MFIKLTNMHQVSLHKLSRMRGMLVLIVIFLLPCISNGLPLKLVNTLSTSSLPSQSDCTTHKDLIVSLIKFNVFAFLPILLYGNRRLLKCGPCRKPQDDENTIDWSILGLLGKVGSEIGKNYGLAVLTQASRADPQVWKYFQLWAIRQRATPFIAILGYHRGWTGAALNSFIMDSIFCIIAAQFTGTASIVSGDFEKDQGSWPTYRIGAIISLIPLILFVILGLIMIVVLAMSGCFTLCGCACGQGGNNDATMEWENKNYGWYTGYFVLFTIMYVGRWMMWSGIPLELYCPVIGDHVNILMALSPFAMQLVVFLLDVFSEWIMS